MTNRSTIILGLFIGSPAAPAEAARPILAALQQVKVIQSDGDAPAGFELGFRAERKASAKEYPLLSNPLLKQGNRVIVTVTLKAQPHVLMDGIITSYNLTPGKQRGTVDLALKGHDLSIMMDLEYVGMAHKGKGPKEIALFILNKYAQLGISAQVGDPQPAVVPAPEQASLIQSETDRECLQRLARQHGFEFRVKPGPVPKKSVGYWGPPERALQPLTGLTWNMGAGTNVETLDFDYDALATTGVVGAVSDPAADEPKPGQALGSKLKPALTRQNALKDYADFVRKVRLNYPGGNLTEALARAQATANISAASAGSASGTLDTFTYGDLLVAPGKVGVRTAGGSFDGDYLISEVTHTITRGEYKQAFKLKREGMGTLTQKVKNG